MTGKIFSESWYRIADQRVALRNQVQMRFQMFRGERWYVVEDPFTNQFFRIRPEAREFLVRLGPGRTVGEVWQECLASNPDHAPGQEDVIKLLAQLHEANLLQYGLPEDSLRLFERHKKRRKKEMQAKLLGVLFVRIPLIDPDGFLKRTVPWVGKVFSRAGAAVWIAVVLLALKFAVDNFGALLGQSQGILAPSNLFFLYASLVFLMTLHEFGHAYACRKFGGEVHTMGIMFMLLTPIPYVDASSSWAIRSRWERALVGAAGMIVELFIAALAVIVWANTGPGIINSLAYNIMFIASVTTLLFNLNPLLRFDGYYILSDLLDIPSLHTRSIRQLRHLCERHLFGYAKSTSPARSRKEAGWLTAFALASGVYKVFLFVAITMFVADRFLLLGLIMAAVCIVTMGIVPLVRFGSYLLHSPHLDRHRGRAVGVVAGFLAVVFAVLQWVPVWHSFRAPGILKADSFAEVSSASAGRLSEVLVPSGREVRAGEVLYRMSDPELRHRLMLADAEVREVGARYRRALLSASSDLETLTAYLASVEERRSQLRQQQADLEVKAPIDGTWVAPDIAERNGQWIPRGKPTGHVVDGSAFNFSAVVPQSEVSRLFSGQVRDSMVRLRGQGGRDIPVAGLRYIPADREQLPSAALGWFSGGDIAVVGGDSTGRTAAEPFFEVIADVEAPSGARFFHGASGSIRFSLPAEPLLPRWARSFRQLLQKRYQL
jgi:putative peptide zinc metalloprotease protein